MTLWPSRYKIASACGRAALTPVRSPSVEGGSINANIAVSIPAQGRLLAKNDLIKK